MAARTFCRGVLLHYSYPTHQAYREKFDRYTAIEASGLRATGIDVLVQSLRTPLRFLWYSIVRRSALDGIRGLRVAWWSALYPAVVTRKAVRTLGRAAIRQDDDG